MIKIKKNGLGNYKIEYIPKKKKRLIGEQNFLNKFGCVLLLTPFYKKVKKYNETNKTFKC